jgi:hypothetical protein
VGHVVDKRDTKLADGSCECCRIALASDSQGRVAALWRHVFEPNERDHAFAFLGTPQAKVERATVDRWRVDACPHQGPSLAFGPDGTRHAVWFNQVDGQRFDGSVTKIESLLSNDAGRSFAPGPSLQTAGDSDQPRLVKAGERILVVWRNADGIAVLAGAVGSRMLVLHAVAQTHEYAIDATWLGEKPRAYRYDVDGKREAFSGVIQLPTSPTRNP